MIRLYLLNLIVLAAFLLAPKADAKPAPSESVTIVHSLSTRGNVEQQTPDGCYFDDDLSDCVTNTNPIVWDVDDHAEARGTGVIEIPLWGDRGGHVWWWQYCVHKRQSPTMTVTFDAEVGPDYSTVSEPQKTWRSGRFSCASGCIFGPSYHDQASLPEVPHQGGQGGTLGHAIAVTVRFEITGGASFFAGADLTTDNTSQRYCGYDGSVPYIEWVMARECEDVTDVYTARYCR